MRRIKQLEESPLLDEQGNEIDKAPLRATLQDEMRDGLRDCGAFLGKIAPALIASKKARKELLKELPTPELEAQFRQQIAGISDEEWKALEKLRNAAKETK